LEVLLEQGWGVVSGGGAGIGDPGFFVDLELDTCDEGRVKEFLDVLLAYLRSLPAPKGTYLTVVLDDPENSVRVQVYD
jgi:hypothetical protein